MGLRRCLGGGLRSCDVAYLCAAAELPEPRPAKVDRTQLPELRTTRPFPFPAIEKSTLPNGMRVWTVHHTQMPLVAFTLLVRRGASSDPHGKEGLAAVTADMLDEGSGDRSAIEMHEALARLGAQFDTDIGSDATVTAHGPQPLLAARTRTVAGHRRAGGSASDFAACVSCGCIGYGCATRRGPSPIARSKRSTAPIRRPFPIGSEAALASMVGGCARVSSARQSAAVATLIAVGDAARRDREAGGEAFADWAGAGEHKRAPSNRCRARRRSTRAPRPRAPQSELHRPGDRWRDTPTTTRSSCEHHPAASSSRINATCARTRG
jgi:hypothetical protein